MILRKIHTHGCELNLCFKIFINTINHAVDTMQKAGIKADVKRQDNGDSYVYHIVIPKKMMYKFTENKNSK